MRSRRACGDKGTNPNSSPRNIPNECVSRILLETDLCMGEKKGTVNLRLTITTEMLFQRKTSESKCVFYVIFSIDAVLIDTGN